jgi:hypothetical protein
MIKERRQSWPYQACHQHLKNVIMCLIEQSTLSQVLHNPGSICIFVTSRLCVTSFLSVQNWYIIEFVMNDMQICRIQDYELYSLIFMLGLQMSWSPVQGFLPTVYRIKKLKKQPGPNKGLWSHSFMNKILILPYVPFFPSQVGPLW